MPPVDFFRALRGTFPVVQYHGTILAGISCTDDSRDLSKPYTVTTFSNKT